MRETFETVVAALWASLDLAPPPQGEAEPAAVLRIDGRTVTLTPSRDEDHILVATPLGPLAPEEHRREAQLRGLLRDSLGMLLVNQACLCLAEGAPPRAQVVALGPCRVAAVPRLRALIEDVLYLADIHAPTLAAQGRGGTAPRSTEVSGDADSLIFRL